MILPSWNSFLIYIHSYSYTVLPTTSGLRLRMTPVSLLQVCLSGGYILRTDCESFHNTCVHIAYKVTVWVALYTYWVMYVFATCRAVEIATRVAKVAIPCDYSICSVWLLDIRISICLLSIIKDLIKILYICDWI